MSTVRVYIPGQDDGIECRFDRVPCIGERLHMGGIYEVRMVSWVLYAPLKFVASVYLNRVQS